MKASILFYSKTGTTQKMAEKIAEGMRKKGVDAKTFSIDDVDKEWVLESSCVIVGSPTYYADVAGKLKMFLEELGKYSVAGKIGGAFATSAYSYGGGDIALQTILTHMMFWGCWCIPVEEQMETHLSIWDHCIGQC
jgi:NAD(P)H dehydrogenase (quinone)